MYLNIFEECIIIKINAEDSPLIVIFLRVMVYMYIYDEDNENLEPLIEFVALHLTFKISIYTKTHKVIQPKPFSLCSSYASSTNYELF